MILLEPGNRILAETVAAQVKTPENVQNDDGVEQKGVRLPIDVTLCDFDDVKYHAVTDAAAPNLLRVSLQLPCWDEIAEKGGKAALDRIYGSMVQATPEAHYSCTLVIDLDALPAGETQATLVDKVGKFKANIVGGAFDYHFQALQDGKYANITGTDAQKAALSKEVSTSFKLRHDTIVYFVPKNDRITVLYSLDFQDRVDSAIAKVFMQEFVDARRKMGQAPPCTFGVNPPLELQQSFGILEPTGNLGFISFAVMTSHITQHKGKVIDVLSTFRSYVQYHLKCSKSYFHSRMRARVVSLLKMLNRAKVDNPDEQKAKKTAGGKTFVRAS